MPNNSTYSIKIHKESKNALRDIPNDTIRAVLNGLVDTYFGMEDIEVLLKEREIKVIEKDIKQREEEIKALQELKREKEEDLEEFRDVQKKELRALEEGWQDIKRYGLGVHVADKLDYQQIYALFMRNLMPNDRLVNYCIAKLSEHKEYLEKTRTKRNAKHMDREIKKTDTLIKECQRLDKMLATGEMGV